MADGYDPRMLQMARMGIGMMGPQAGPFDRANQPKQWWDQPVQYGQPANRPVNTPDSEDPNDPERKKPQPSLLQMLMLGGPATYSGTPRPSPPGGNPWGWLGSMGGGGRP